MIAFSVIERRFKIGDWVVPTIGGRASLVVDFHIELPIVVVAAKSGKGWGPSRRRPYVWEEMHREIDLRPAMKDEIPK